MMMETIRPEIRSIRISADQKSILKKTFEKFPHPNHSTEALDLLSLKTGLRPELIRKWFQKRRLALNKKNDDDEIQILDDNCEINSTNTGELENYDEDYIDLDNDDSSETSSATGAVSSTSGAELSMEAKAAEYNLLKQQMEALQSQMSQMTQNLDFPPDNPPPPPPVSNYYYPSQGYNFQSPQQYSYQQYQPQLPYPPYSNYLYPPAPLPGYSNPSYWTLPYPPPDFQFLIPDPPALAREDQPEPAPVLEKQELEDCTETDRGEVGEAREEIDHGGDENPDKLENERYDEEKEQSNETQANEETRETSKTVDSETEADQFPELETKEDLENVEATPESAETEEKSSHVSAISKEESLCEPVSRAEITDSSTEAILERYKDIGESSQNTEASQQAKRPLTPYKKNASLATLEEEDFENELNDDDLKTFEEETSGLTEKNNLDSSLSLLITSTDVVGEETLDEQLPARDISESGEKSNLSNVSFLQALEEVPPKTETAEVVPVDDEKPAPRPFIVKEEPKEVKPTKLGRKSLPTKSKQRAFVPVATFDEMDSEELYEEQNLSEISSLPPARTKTSYKNQNIKQTTQPVFAGSQKTSQPNSRQKTKAQSKEPPAAKIVKITHGKPVQSPVTPFKSSPAPPRPQQSQPARGSKRAQAEKSQSRAKMPRQKPPAAPTPRITKINNYTTITVTKVVEPPSIPPSERPELQRILKMSNLSVSIKR